MKHVLGRDRAGATRPFAQLPKRLWALHVAHANVREGCRWGDASRRVWKSTSDLRRPPRHRADEFDSHTGPRGARGVAAACSALELPSDGKDTNKEARVTAGGVRLKEINFRTYESKSVPGLPGGDAAREQRDGRRFASVRRLQQRLRGGDERRGDRGGCPREVTNFTTGAWRVGQNLRRRREHRRDERVVRGPRFSG